jgi:hypothetical protein
LAARTRGWARVVKLCGATQAKIIRDIVQSIDMNTLFLVVVRLCLVMVTLLGLCFILLLGVLSIARDLLADEPDRSRAPLDGDSRRSDATPLKTQLL